MPLTGEAKKDYQREYMRSYMKDRRAVKTPVVAVKTSLRPELRPVKTLVLDPKQEVLSNLRGIIDAVQSNSSPLPEESNTIVPMVYRPGMKPPPAGTMVRVQLPGGKYKTMEMPDLDADGNVV